MTKYTGSDAAKDTGSTPKEVSRSWHDARDDAAKEGGWGVPKNRHDSDDKNGSGDSSK